MRFKTLGFAGYLLSAFIMLLLVIIPQIVIYFVILLIPYVVSIILRFLAWRGVAETLDSRVFKVVSLAVLVLGVLFVVSIFLMQAQVSDFPLFLVPWVIYSFLEAVGYVYLGRRGSRLAYGGVINIPAVISITALLTPPAIVEAFLALHIVRAFLVMLVVSALSVALAFKRFTPLSERYASIRPVVREASPTTRSGEEFHQEDSILDESYQVEHVETTPRGRTLTIEVISRSGDLVCRVCGNLNPIGARVCASCGRKPFLDGPGAKCPVCRAPLVYATRLDSDRLLCGVCFSELQIIR